MAEADVDLDQSSTTICNDWIIDNRIAPVAALTDVRWTAAHLLVARRPRKS